MMHGLYGILPSISDTDILLDKAESALRGGVRIVQFRNKKDGYKRALKQAKALRTLTHKYQATLIINDSLSMMEDCDADGVHVGRDDVADLLEMRARLGATRVLGVTCRADAAFARLALQQGADYVSFGAVFASTSKPEVPVLGLPRLLKCCQMFPDAKLCAIGGITEDNIAAVRHSGVDMAAVISGLFDAPDVQRQAERLLALWGKV